MQTRLHDPLLRALVLQMLIKGLQEDSASTGRAVELAFLKKKIKVFLIPVTGRLTAKMGSIKSKRDMKDVAL